MSVNKCRICGSKEVDSFMAREMMFGTKDQFEYFQCQECRTIQIAQIPENMSIYYPDNYNAYEKKTIIRDYFLKRVLKKYMANSYLTNNQNWLSSYLMRKNGVGFLRNLLYANIDFNAQILDVGCGIGHRLIGLNKYGFKNLVGIEPFIRNDIIYSNGVKIYKRTIFEHKGQYDFIMLNHVFEHVEAPFLVFEAILRLLKEGGIIHLSMPVADSFAWRKYKENWVALDPPRHLHIFSEKGLGKLVGKYGYHISKVIYDSSSYQFWGSEQFVKGIPLRAENSYYESKENSIFNDYEIGEFEKQAKACNDRGEGDTACFVIRKD